MLDWINDVTLLGIIYAAITILLIAIIAFIVVWIEDYNWYKKMSAKHVDYQVLNKSLMSWLNQYRYKAKNFFLNKVHTATPTEHNFHSDSEAA